MYLSGYSVDEFSTTNKNNRNILTLHAKILKKNLKFSDIKFIRNHFLQFQNKHKLISCSTFSFTSIIISKKIQFNFLTSKMTFSKSKKIFRNKPNF